MVTVAKACAGLAWCVNPCRVVYEERDMALRFLVPPGTSVRPPQNPAESPTRAAVKEDTTGKAGGGLWAGRAPKNAPAWATFSPGLRYKGRQSAVAYATKTGHLIQVPQAVGAAAVSCGAGVVVVVCSLAGRGYFVVCGLRERL